MAAKDHLDRPHRLWGARPRLGGGRVLLLWRRGPARDVASSPGSSSRSRCLILFVAGRGFRRTWAPLGSLMDATGRLAEGEYGARVEPAGPPQLREVMGAFNRMAGRIEAADEQRRRLLADLSHELRTPLTVIQGSVEAMLDGVHPADEEHLSRLLEETRVLSRLLDDLRTVTLAEAGRLSLQLESTDLGAARRRRRVLAPHPGRRRRCVGEGRRGARPPRVGGRPGTHQGSGDQPGDQRPTPHPTNRAYPG